MVAGLGRDVLRVILTFRYPAAAARRSAHTAAREELIAMRVGEMIVSGGDPIAATTDGSTEFHLPRVVDSGNGSSDLALRGVISGVEESPYSMRRLALKPCEGFFLSTRLWTSASRDRNGSSGCWRQLRVAGIRGCRRRSRGRWP